MRMRPLSTLAMGLLVVPASIGLASAAQAAPVGSAQSAGGYLFTGNAYGTFGYAGPRVIAGRSSFLALCTSAAGSGQSSGASSVSVPDVVRTGAITSSVGSQSNGTTAGSKTSDTTNGTSLLSGLVTARVVKAVSSTTHGATGFEVDAAGSTFTHVTVNGHAVSSQPAPNTAIALPGVGRVVLNQQARTVGATSAMFTVDMVHVYVTHSLPGVPKGSQIVVGHATSGLATNKAGSLNGTAYGTAASAGSKVVSGPTARVVMACGGTTGGTNTNSAATVNVPNVISTGPVTDTAQGTVSATTAAGETTSRTQTVQLMGGLVTADAIKADAHASKSGGNITLGDAGSSFVNLVVNGKPIPADVAPNTKIVVGNITIWLHRLIRFPNTMEVRMLDVSATGSNPFGVPIGTHVLVAVAAASVH